ncbi:MAG: hypothetical protein GC206_06620 [Alphaproteobacteria bacterium]|nr:hypothetical protein [Alphaproteobacteria bacterium]
MDWAAVLSILATMVVGGADARPTIVAELRRLGRTVRALLLLAALRRLRPRPRRACRASAAPPGARVRLHPRGSLLRLAMRTAFTRAGFASRDPSTLVAAILSALAARKRAIALLVKRLSRGLALGRLVLTRPPALVHHTAAPPAPVCSADTS